MKLNIGSGTNRKGGYIGLDLYSEVADVMIDATKPLPFDDGSVDEIYSSHFIEHLSRDEWETVSKDWKRLIGDKGKIEIICPDIKKTCAKFLQDPTNEFWMKAIYGSQEHPGQFHKNGITIEEIRSKFMDYNLVELPPSTAYELHVKLYRGRE